VTSALASPGGWGSDAIKQAGDQMAARRLVVRFTGSGVRRFLAASSRRAWDFRSGHACRVLRGRAFGRGFDSRRLHHRSLRSLGFGGVVRQAGFGLRPRL